MIIKVCGIKYKANLLEVLSARPDILGFIFYKPSLRYAGEELSPSDLEIIPPSVIKTGVFVNDSECEILAKVHEYGLNIVQLHGNESPDFCRNLNHRGFSLIKTFHIDEYFDFSVTDNYADFTDFFLFDTRGKGYGGNGFCFDWSVLSRYNGKTPFLLSGGISSDKYEAIKIFRHKMFAGIDLNSGFEREPGIKDSEKLDEFIKKLRQ
jgi:phosphoribosylanthranilate isomerase